ncbi:NADH-dependent phenylglyoxylate dehydrogenase subunit epsilon [Pseudodesulfovibrio hydrargyri]|uniref:NADH-dependent phenylglyoxylate dehydrogenase subunit epsilon n=1 Tax=Pseudodesulfovibrio hydrargyri TaxID=2125990 RepID=A0A1J5NBC3_9BACT|nr:FAD/NAD(P)-binding oxidoreductase [Pseudodesulfovibrio hydrargyri]OIQ50527.1 NADH-dependent phenylglyoxylate dehydrogenase subunit epsilon [Pseudodesulfovibrio hydrargyri]
MSTQYVMIGAGPAAQSAAKVIRTADKDGEIVFITREETLPYSPVALPYLLDDMKSDALFAKGQQLLKDLNVSFVTGKEVAGVDANGKQVLFSDGSSQAYDKLLVATGASPIRIPVEGLTEEDTFVFRTFADYERLAANCCKGGDVLIYGAGLVSVELAEKLSHSGYNVTIVVRSHLLRRYFSPETVATLQKMFADKGVNIISGTTIASAKKNGGKYAVTLSNGETKDFDALVMALGVTPNLVQGLEVAGGGIKADQWLAAAEDVYVAGDVAAPADYTGTTYEPCPISPEAAKQGKIAGRNMTGEKQRYDGWVSMNYFRIFDENLFSIGEIEGQTKLDCEILSTGSDNKTLKLLFDKDVLVGVEGFGQKEAHPGVFAFLIRNRVSVGDNKELLLNKPRETALWLMQTYREEHKL